MKTSMTPKNIKSKTTKVEKTPGRLKNQKNLPAPLLRPSPFFSAIVYMVLLIGIMLIGYSFFHQKDKWGATLSKTFKHSFTKNETTYASKNFNNKLNMKNQNEAAAAEEANSMSQNATKSLKKNEISQNSKSLNPTQQIEKPKNKILNMITPELKLFSSFEGKVLFTEQESNQKNKIMKDPTFLASINSLLLESETTEEIKKWQNVALEALIEALSQKEVNTEARKIAKNIIQNNQIENIKMPLESRKNLAEIKAELLFNWISQEPTISSTIPSWLPGPVSQKIWKNIQNEQLLNQATSASASEKL